jgi:hypothetical protein
MQSRGQLAEQITMQIRARHGDDRWIECEVLEERTIDLTGQG